MFSLRKTQRFEQFFWNRTGKETKVEDVQKAVAMVESDLWLRKLVDLLEDIQGKEILDCGCGTGSINVYLGMRGAYAQGFDISPEMLKVARINEKKNDINGKCSFLCCAFEDLPYRDISFDLAVGAYVLHHVNIERAMKELHRVLKPGGKAFFVETWGKNPLLLLARKYLAGRFGIAKYGTKNEHPITPRDINGMEKVFSEVRLYFPEFIFFRKAGTNIFRWKKSAKIITDVLVKMDNLITHRFPTFNKYGYRCIITLLKE